MNENYQKILSEYLSWLDTLGYSNDVILCSRFSIRDLFEWLENKQITSINLVTNKHINDFRYHLETRPNMRDKNRFLTASHLNKHFTAIDKLLEFLHNYGMTTAPTPLKKYIRTDDQERVYKLEVFTQTEIKTLYNCIENTFLNINFAERQAKHYELKLIFALLYGCGLRRTEAANLRIKDVNFDKKTVFVEQGKCYKDRIVPMSAGVYKDLQDYIYNFRKKQKTNHNRLIIREKQILHTRLKKLQKICQDENIQAKRITPHILRHSIATHLLQNGMSIENIARFLGHNSLVSTQIYTHIVNQL